MMPKMCKYVCACVSVDVGGCVYVYMCVGCMDVTACVYKCVWLCVCLYAWGVYGCDCVYVCLWMCVVVCVCVGGGMCGGGRVSACVFMCTSMH